MGRWKDDEYIISAIEHLIYLSKDELVDVYIELIGYEWNEDKLGQKPHNYDNAKMYDHRYNYSRFNTTRHMYVRPIIDAIERLIPEDELGKLVTIKRGGSLEDYERRRRAEILREYTGQYISY